MSIPRLLAIMGSGETAPTMTKVHRMLFERMGPGPVPAVLLDTPFGFQANADELTDRTISYFRESVDRAMAVATFRRASAADGLAVEQLRIQLRDARLVFAGPGSPSYALRQWAGSPVPGELTEKLRTGGCVTFSSAAALTLGVATVPVYEVYKVGADPQWLPGLDLTAVTGLSLAVIPHYDNAEGGTHDTRFCYLGESRLRMIEPELDPATFVFGIDEHTAAVFDLDQRTMSVLGRGGVTIRVDGRSAVLAVGTALAIDDLADMAEGLRHPGGSVPAPVEVPVSNGSTDSAVGPDAEIPLLATVASLEAQFDDALSRRDAREAVRCALELEAELHAWSADTLQSDDADRGRAALRSMVVRLGEAAEVGVRDPKEVFGPWVEAFLALRSAARQAKRWSDADDIRDRLVSLGVEVRDDPSATTWELA